MDILVRYFSTYRHAVSLNRETVTIDDPATLGGLVTYLVTVHPGLESFMDEMMLSINKEYASLDQELADGDEVALLPPVSGG